MNGPDADGMWPSDHERCIAFAYEDEGDASQAEAHHREADRLQAEEKASVH